MKVIDEDDSAIKDELVSKRKRKSKSRIAKEVVIEMTSFIPRKELEKQWKANSVRWNCGYHCEGYIPSEETEGNLDRCKIRDSKVIETKKRCDKCKIRHQLEVIPDWIDELEEEKEVPRKPSEWRDSNGVYRKSV